MPNRVLKFGMADQPNQMITIQQHQLLLAIHLADQQFYCYVWKAMENPPIFKFGKPSISMGHLSISIPWLTVSHNQRVNHHFPMVFLWFSTVLADQPPFLTDRPLGPSWKLSIWTCLLLPIMVVSCIIYIIPIQKTKKNNIIIQLKDHYITIVVT